MSTIRIHRYPADGPLYLHGRVRVDGAGRQPVALNTRVALCRCGKSGLKPFCDGTHKKIGFKAS